MDAQILIADDDPSIRSLLKLIVEREGLAVDLAADGAEALAKIEKGSHALILLDLQMPRLSGFDVVDRLQQKTRRPLVLVITALPTRQTVQLDPSVVHAVIRKPFDVELLGSVISIAAASILRSPALMKVPQRRGNEFAH
jgi:CheY-like chemotaxis protein